MDWSKKKISEFALEVAQFTVDLKNSKNVEVEGPLYERARKINEKFTTLEKLNDPEVSTRVALEIGREFKRLNSKMEEKID